MDSEDHSLDAMLDTYTVADADAAFLARLAGSADTIGMPQRPRPFLRAAAAAAIALAGFWSGNATIPQQHASRSQPPAAVNIDMFIFGPNHVSEVML